MSTNDPPAHQAPGPQPPGVGRPGELLDRFLARLIDSLIVGVPTSIVAAILTASSGSWFISTAISGILFAAAYLAYFGYFESSRGGGFGKQIMKLQVVAPGGGNPTMEQALRRNAWTGAPILYVIPFLGPLVAGLIELVAVIVCAVNISNDPERRTWFDKLADGTQVVKVG